MTPTFASGKICYVEIPAADPQRASEFYNNCFDWEIRRRGDGAISFDDAVNQVSGAFTTARQSVNNVGTLVYIMVFDIESVISKIEANGGKIVQPVGADAPEITARFADPDGNIFGLYQQQL